MKFWGSFALILGTLFPVEAVTQVGPGDHPILCTVNAPVKPNLRAEGYTELTGDITISCTGGIPPELGAVLPQVSITVFYNTAVTSRLLPQAGASTISEALLLIDEPGSGLPSAVPGFGPAATQNVCATPLAGCVEYVSQKSGSTIPVATDTPQGTAATTPGKNVFQGIASGNSLTFTGVPVLAPRDGTRIFRMTNVRVNASPLGSFSTPGGTPVQASISISGSTSLLINGATPTVGQVNSSLASAANDTVGFSQCSSQALAPAATLSFSGGSFKTRVLAQDNVAYAGQNGTPGLNGFTAQNVPGAQYRSESNFVLPVGTGQTAGLSDFGTRLKAVFNSVPAGVRLFVSVSNVANAAVPTAAPAVPGGSLANGPGSGFAQLTSSETGGFNPVPATNFAPGNSGSVPVVEIPVVNGSATAVWEVIDISSISLNADIAELKFAVYASYTAKPVQNLPAPGSATVNLSYAATPPSFSAGEGSNASSALVIPRFIPDATSARNLFTITGCTAPTATALSVTPGGGTNQYSFTALVTSTRGGTPAGTVTFYDSGIAMAGSTATLNAAATASFVTILTAGSHRISAAFTPSNSSLFLPSASPESAIALGAAPTATALAVTAGGGTNQYSFTAAVTTTSTGAGTPAGTVTFYDNGIAIAGSTATLNVAATANFVTILTAGSHRISAVYTPSNSLVFLPSTSPEAAISFGRASTSMELASSLYPSLAGQAVTFTATVTGAGVAPGGTVQFTDGTQSLGSARLAGGRASVTATLTTVGVHDIFATYGGDGGSAEASARFGQRVERVTDSLRLVSSAATAEFGQAVTLTATLAPQAPVGVAAASGTVQFQEGTTVIGTAGMTAGAATLAISNLTAGTHTIFAVYGGDANWYGARSDGVTVTVNAGATATVLTSSATLTEVRLSAALTPAVSAGSVQFVDSTGNTVLGSVQAANGAATLALAAEDAAKIAGHTVAAIYSGSGGLAGSTSNTMLLPALRNAAGGGSGEFAAGITLEFAAEELVSLFGTKLADGAESSVAAALPQSLGGLRVNVTDASGAVLAGGMSYVSGSQVNFVMPAGLAPGAALVTVMRGGAVAAAIPVRIASVAPGLFGAPQVARTESGDVYLVLYGTGIRNRSGNAGVACVVNGAALAVAYAGAQADFPGLDQVNVLLPADVHGAVSVSVTVDGHASNTVTASIQ